MISTSVSPPASSPLTAPLPLSIEVPRRRKTRQRSRMILTASGAWAGVMSDREALTRAMMLMVGGVTAGA